MEKSTGIIKFESIHELFAYDKEVGASQRYRRHASESWLGKTYAETYDIAQHGDQTIVPDAQALLDQYSMGINMPTYDDVPSVAGGYAIVPEYLAGEIENMRDTVRSVSERGPLAVVMDLTTFAGISAKEYMQRGIATLAFVMAMSQIRPVTLTLLTSLEGVNGDKKYVDPKTQKTYTENFSLISVRVNTTPLDIATAAGLMGHVAVARLLFYGIAEHEHKFHGGWATLGPNLSGGVRGGTKLYQERLFALLGISDEAIYLPIISVAEKKSDIIANSGQWVQDRIAEFATKAEEFV